jgi:hypothetical protein
MRLSLFLKETYIPQVETLKSLIEPYKQNESPIV